MGITFAIRHPPVQWSASCRSCHLVALAPLLKAIGTLRLNLERFAAGTEALNGQGAKGVLDLTAYFAPSSERNGAPT